MTAPSSSRRQFIRTSAAGLGSVLLLPGLLGGCRTGREAAVADGGWDLVPEILARIEPPTFPDRDFLITDYGADGDGTVDSTDAIRRAVQACSEAGGGRVVVPSGDFLTGPIHLESDVNLHVSEGATLLFTRDPQAYLPVVYTRWEGVELMNYSPLIYAFEASNVAVTGSGTVDGQATNDDWWPWKGREEYGWSEGTPEQTPARDSLLEMAEEGVPVEERVFGEDSYLRPSFIQPYRCENVLVEGITIRRAPMWNVHPVLCTNVTVRGLTVDTHGPNNDGCNPESCTDVLIEDCFFDTGDDCIALKSGRNADGRRLDAPVENVVIRNCTMRDGHGGVVMGSEITGGARNIFAEDCQMDSPNLERVLRIKTNSMRGGVVENIYMRNVQVGQVADAVVRINFFYEEGDAGPYEPIVRNVNVENVTSEKSEYALYLRGYEDDPIRNVHLSKCRFSNAEKGNLIEHVDELTFDDVVINGDRLG